MAQDQAYQNAQAYSDQQNARLESDNALSRVVLDMLSDHTELYRLFSQNSKFKRWLGDVVFERTYRRGLETLPQEASAA